MPTVAVLLLTVTRHGVCGRTRAACLICFLSSLWPVVGTSESCGSLHTLTAASDGPCSGSSAQQCLGACAGKVAEFYCRCASESSHSVAASAKYAEVGQCVASEGCMRTAYPAYVGGGGTQQNFNVGHNLDQSHGRNSCLQGSTISACLNCSAFLDNATSACTDVAAPVLQLLGGDAVEVVQVCGRSFQMLNDSSCSRQMAEYGDPFATAFDSVDGNLTSSVVRSGAVDLTTAGTYVLMYEVVDSAMNRATANRTVTVIGRGCMNSRCVPISTMAWKMIHALLTSS